MPGRGKRPIEVHRKPAALRSGRVRFRLGEGKLCYRGFRFFAGWLRIERVAYLGADSPGVRSA